MTVLFRPLAWVAVVLTVAIIAASIFVVLSRVVWQGRERRGRKRRGLFHEALSGLLKGTVSVEEARRGWSFHREDLLAELVESIQENGAEARVRLRELIDGFGMAERGIAELRSRTWVARSRAANSLGYIGGPSAIAPLVGALEDEMLDVRLSAARALSRLGAKEAVSPILHCLPLPAPWTIARLLEILSAMGEAAIGPLLDFSRDTKEPPLLRAVAVRVLGMLHAKGVAPIAIAYLADPDPEIRVQGIKALADAGDGAAAEPLLAAMSDATWQVRAVAAVALGRLGVEAAIPVLRKTLSDRIWWVRLNSADSLFRLGPLGIDTLKESARWHQDRFARDISRQVLDEHGLSLDTQRGTAMILQALIMVLFVYYLTLHALYWLLIIIGIGQHRSYYKGIKFGEFQGIIESPQTLPISLIIGVYNEERIIVDVVRGALGLRYPQFEVVIVNDGSRDRSLEVLIDHFGLRQISKVWKHHLQTEPIRGIYASFDHPSLIVVDKENGRRADALNAGADVARYPLVCLTDADCILEEDALIRLARPFILNPKTIASTGIIRPSNGLVAEHGKVVRYGLPRRWLCVFQVVEYLRAFQWGRLGLARLRSMLCISGAFTLVRREVFYAVGGLNSKVVSEDVELTLALYQYVYENEQERGYEIAYVPDPVCYTEVPDRVKFFGAQRRRWQHGTLQSIVRHRRMLLNPRYRLTGLFGMPFFLIYEGLAGVVEGTSWLLMPIMYFLGLATVQALVLFFIFAAILGTSLSMGAVLLEERTRLRQGRIRDLLRLLLAGLLENFGFHQLHLYWRVVGTLDYLRSRTHSFEVRQRAGFLAAPKGKPDNPTPPPKPGAPAEVPS